MITAVEVHLEYRKHQNILRRNSGLFRKNSELIPFSISSPNPQQSAKFSKYIFKKKKRKKREKMKEKKKKGLISKAP